MFWVSWENALHDINVSTRIHHCKLFLSSTTFWFQSAKANRRRITSSTLWTLSTVYPMPGGCLVTIGPQTTQLIARCTTFLCHWENVTVGLILLFIGFVLIYSVFCIWTLWLMLCFIPMNGFQFDYNHTLWNNLY